MSTARVHGVNLSGWFLLESWITPELFSGSGVLTEPELAKALGWDKYITLLDKHCATFITEYDFMAIAMRGFNAVRIPIPWYIFGNENPDAPSHAPLIQHLDNAFDWAENTGLEIVLDLAQVPGATVSNDRLSMRIDLSEENQRKILDVTTRLVERYCNRSSFLGIQPLGQICSQNISVLNRQESLSLAQLRAFYRELYKQIRLVGGRDIVVILNDAGLASKWRWFMAQHRYENVWLDTHVYHFKSKASTLLPETLSNLIDATKQIIKKAKTSRLPVIVGEFCVALPLEDSLLTPEGKVALERLFLSGQLSVFDTCEGWFFQTWKTSARVSAWDARLAFASVQRDLLE